MIRSEVSLVVLPITIVDRSGRPVDVELPRDAFTVLEDGTPQSIRVFRHEDVPVSLGLILDHSGSMSYKLEKVAAAALDLVKNSNPDDEVFIVSFSRRPHLDADFTNDGQILQQALQRGTIRGNTAVRDAVWFAIRHMTAAARKDKRLLIVITDGEDIESSISLGELVSEAQRRQIAIYAIGLGADSRRARRDLRKLAEETGGAAFFPMNVTEIDHIAHGLAQDIRSQYTIGYTPSSNALDGRYRTISVKLKGDSKLMVRTRTGYFRPEPESPVPTR